MIAFFITKINFNLRSQALVRIILC